MIPGVVTVEVKAFLRNLNVKQQQETHRSQPSKITSQSLVSSACFLLTIPSHSLVPALQCASVCVCVCAHAHIKASTSPETLC